MKISDAENTIRWYDLNAEKYASTTEQHAQIDEIDEFVNLIPNNGIVIDVGCGSGRDSGLLLQRGLNPVGIDLSEGLVKEAQKRHPQIDFIQADMLQIPFPDNHFDGVWAHASILHLETVDDVKKALSEIARITKVRGLLHVLVKAQTGNEKTAIVSDTLSNHDRFFQYFTQSEVESLLNEAGFVVIKNEQYHETERDPKGRPEVEWILALARKS